LKTKSQGLRGAGEKRESPISLRTHSVTREDRCNWWSEGRSVAETRTIGPSPFNILTMKLQLVGIQREREREWSPPLPVSSALSLVPISSAILRLLQPSHSSHRPPTYLSPDSTSSFLSYSPITPPATYSLHQFRPYLQRPLPQLSHLFFLL
jgi:hypothetical protein